MNIVNKEKETGVTNDKGLGIGSLALGAIAGAVAGILLAPKAGKETRQDIKSTLMHIKDDVAAKISELKDITEHTYHSVIDTVVKTYEDTKQLTADEAGTIKADLADGYDDIKHAVRKNGKRETSL